MKRSFRGIATFAGSSMFALALTGCGIPLTSDGDHNSGFTGYEGYVEIYRETVDAFPELMPEGVEFPDLPPKMEGSIGRGNGMGAAYFFWECAWQDIYLHSDDELEKSAALVQMERVPGTEWAVKYLEDPDGIYLGWINEAKLGDPSIIAEIYQTGCTYYREQMGIQE